MEAGIAAAQQEDDVVEAHCYLSISGELIMSRYVAATYLLTISSPDNKRMSIFSDDGVGQFLPGRAAG